MYIQEIIIEINWYLFEIKSNTSLLHNYTNSILLRHLTCKHEKTNHKIIFIVNEVKSTFEKKNTFPIFK
jgi:hypothetical protein